MTEQVTVKLPSAATYHELLAEGLSPEAAEHKMHERVFGVGFKKDADGKPIEQGMGAPANQTGQHKAALKLAADRSAKEAPNSADVIAKAVEAGVKAGLAAKDQF